jgi:hypothetical protein
MKTQGAHIKFLRGKALKDEKYARFIEDGVT